jgi:hypothetical protein
MALLFARLDLVKDSYLLEKTYIETHCKITFGAQHLNEIFKKAKFIHLVREPIGYYRSAMRRGYYQSHRADVAQIVPAKENQHKLWLSLSVHEKIMWNWNETNLYIKKFLSVIPKEKYLTVMSQDLYTDIAAAENVLRFCGACEIDTKRLSRVIGKKYNASPIAGANMKEFIQNEKILDLVDPSLKEFTNV